MGRPKFDEINAVYPNKLKAALRFWEILKNSDLPKVYSREFVENNKDKVGISGSR